MFAGISNLRICRRSNIRRRSESRHYLIGYSMDALENDMWRAVAMFS